MNTTLLGLLALSLVSMLVPGESTARRSPLYTKEKSVRAGDNARLAAKVTRDEIVEALDALAAEHANFLNQLELSTAHKAFDRAYGGATNMVNADGIVSQESADEFHNYLDEFLRALKQLETGPWPNDSTYGKSANAAAKKLADPLSMAELKRVGKRLRPELEDLKSAANENPLLVELDITDIPKKDPVEFVSRTLRLIDRIGVITRRCGLGPFFKPANAAARPLKKDMLRLAQIANNLLDDAGHPVAERVGEFEKWLSQAIDNSKSMRRNAKAWNVKGFGARGKLVEGQLESLQRAFKSERRRWKVK